MRVSPVPGRLVRMPENGREITETTEVPDDDGFYIRRLQDGDLTLEKPETDKHAEPQKTDSSKKKGGE